MANDITWRNVSVKLKELKPWSHNPRSHTKKQAERLLHSWQKFGQVQTIVVGPDFEVYDGHQRLSVLLTVYGPDYEIDARQSSRSLDEEERRVLCLLLHSGAVGIWDWKNLRQWNIEELREWGFDKFTLQQWDQDVSNLRLLLRSKNHPIPNIEIGYKGQEIEPIKLAFRLEAAWRAEGNLALDLFAGKQQLAFWYRRRFKKVVTNDKRVTGNDFMLSAERFIEEKLDNYLDFDFIDFDDEGSPAVEIRALFAKLSGRRKKPFVLALTDGQGLTFKLRCDYNPRKYLIDEDTRQANAHDYAQFEEMVTQFMLNVTNMYGFKATQWSSYRGKKGNCLYQTWFIEPDSA